MSLKIKSRAPSFKLKNENGDYIQSSKFIGNWTLIYFYPRDNTTGCTKEACSIEENLPDFKKLKCNIIGISPDTPNSHKKFKEKYKLSFTLLSDVEKIVLKQFKVWKKKKFMGKEYMGVARTSFLIDPKWKLIKIYENVNPTTHAEEVLKDLEKISINKKQPKKPAKTKKD